MTLTSDNTPPDNPADLSLVLDFATAIGELSSVKSLYWLMADEIAELLELDDCVLYLRKGENLFQQSASGIKESDHHVDSPIIIPVGKGVVGTCALTSQTQRIADCSQFPGFIADSVTGLSELAVPVLFEGEVIGVFDTESSQTGFFQDRHQYLLEKMALIAAPRIDACIQRDKLENAVVYLLDKDKNKKQEAKGSSTSDLIPGFEIGDHILSRLIGAQGPTTLWEATQTSLHRRVLLRVLAKTDRSQGKLFHEKAAIASQLNRYSISKVLDFGEDDGRLWIAEEFVPDTQPLADFLDAVHRLPALPQGYFDTTTWMGFHIASALTYAHSHGIFHGAVSPENILMTAGAAPRLMGFGLQAQPAIGVTAESLVLADLRASGATLYETICFQKPDLDNFVPPSLIRSQTPIAVEEICLALLGKSDSLKINTMAEAVAAFQQFKPSRKTKSPNDSTGTFMRWLKHFGDPP
ncbi:MAG: GAF domain-containing protein [Planctomycetes bacterium]|jgi:putative methionine-R-sulfoxide reductase with GAF domain|nr:GAF domain-containing protein [Planctomycetota bacterium]